MNGVGQHAGRDDDEQRAGPLEERGQVDLQGTAVEEPAEDDGGGDAEEAADHGNGALACCTGRGPEEKGCLETLADDRDEGDEHHGYDADLGGVVKLALELALDVAGGALHPEDHPRDESDGHEGGDTGEDDLRALGHGLGGEGQGHGKQDRQDDGSGHAEPDPAQVLTTIRLDQVGDQDAHDESRLDAFTQADEVVREHGAPFPSG